MNHPHTRHKTPMVRRALLLAATLTLGCALSGPSAAEDAKTIAMLVASVLALVGVSAHTIHKMLRTSAPKKKERRTTERRKKL